MATNFEDRRDRLRRALAGRRLGAVVVTDPANVRYLTNFTGSSAHVVATPERTFLLSDGRYEEQIRSEVTGVEVVIRPMTQKLADATAGLLDTLEPGSVALEADHATLALAESLQSALPGVSFRPTSGLVQALRRVKDDAELAEIRRAIAVAEVAIRRTLADLRPEETERQFAHRLDYELRLSGATGSAFPPIVAGGVQAALPHATPRDVPLGASEFLLVDWGADCGYHSDLTRTFSLPWARPSDGVFETVWHAVESAHAAAVAELRAGARAGDADRAARQALSQAPVPAGWGTAGTLAELFTHGLGHGLGLEVHESPDLRSTSSDVLEAGMVVTIEPGVYRPGWGGVRLEDDYLVTKAGAERLSTWPRRPEFLS